MFKRVYVACCSAFDGRMFFTSLSAAREHISSIRKKFSDLEFEYWIEVYRLVADGKYEFSRKIK